MKINRTTQRSVEILRMVSTKPEGMTLDEICQMLNLPKTSAYDIVTTLVHMEMLHVAKGQKQSYTIGLMAYRIGINYINHSDWMATIEPELKTFAKEIGKTVFFGISSGRDVVYLSKAEPETPIITTATVGTKNPMYCTSLGKSILAHTEKEELQKILAQIKFEKKTDRTIPGREEFEKELEKVRTVGYAVDDREMEEHMKCVGAPVFGFDGSVLGAISASSLYKPSEDYQALGERVLAKAAELSRLLGFLGNKQE